MFNVMLDRLPTEYKGFPINSSFRIGIQISQLLGDNGLSEVERLYKAYDLLFLDEGLGTGETVPFKNSDGGDIPPPDLQTAQEGILWFLTGWYTDNTAKGKEKEEPKKDMDYDVDQWRIFSAFLTQFGVNLNTEDMHFWAFMGLLSTLEECAFTRIVDIRTKNRPQNETL